MFKTVFIYLPISVIGIWRWSYWMVRVIGASLYRPRPGIWPARKKCLTLSIVTPVYNEDQQLFIAAMESWIQNGVDEIIAVVDKTNTRLIVEFERRYSNLKDMPCRLIVTAKPGKRAALCDGVARAQSDLIALVDSDTVWSSDVVQKTLPYFLDKKIGAVTIRQRIMNPETASNVVFDILLWNRYQEEVPFLLGLGKAFNTLSGRTAIYRAGALRGNNHDNLHDLRHESFLGARSISGDDKRLTHLVLEQGWHLAYVKGPVVSTQGLNKTHIFLKQRVRWTRNSWRADLRAIKRGWVWKHPVLAFYMIDRLVQPVFMLLGPVICIVAIAAQEWLVVGILVSWWLVSRFIRLFSYFRHYPKRIVYLPAYIFYSYFNALIKVYALATVLENSWVSRWHKNRLRQRLVRRSATVLAGTTAVLAFLVLMANFGTKISRETSAQVTVPAPVGAREFILDTDGPRKIYIAPALPAGAIFPTGIVSYVIQPGDTMNQLAERFGMSLGDLKKLNGLRDLDKINAGHTILYYHQELTGAN
ncbi:MAG: hypothetical protein A3B14_01800 [Candidatus Zambryskibacteria bacterium RIFCSPLOWO2_01_FULL_45_21]|uniref:LysM domain-containing protein n=1 Tax=Candidatus Zambryskibacteria bacterium RIFCSPLOWO2_01_FULL_45_21 TaxID=1802761 RepID=A0A1G2U3Q5_9BACT|nr:MAG: hypothetical protein A3B14_01800 [Candidatus Zambryskibacteria bacterium RIFCSPLOWO2_01_FULL_45_21]